MGSLSILPFDPGSARPAAELLARARRERFARCPLLPLGLKDASAAERILAALGGGFVARDEEGKLAAFLFAARREDGLWGDRIEAGVDAWALGPGADLSALAGLYAAAFGAAYGASRPEEPGRSALGPAEHRVYCPAYDPALLRAWFELGFGIEQAYAVARLEDLDARGPLPAGIEIRRARAGDENALESLSGLISGQQAGPPVWAGAPPEYLRALREGFRGLATDPEAIVLLAIRGGRALGFQAWFPAEPDLIDVGAEAAAELSVAATVPEERGGGIGLALAAAGIRCAREAGYSTCSVDWRTANPLASAFWRRRGFEPHLYRLVRRLPALALAGLVE